MKKFAKILACIAMCFSLTGCFSTLYTRTGSNELINTCESCKEVTNIEILANNVETTMKKVNVVSGSYELVNTKETYMISFDIVGDDKRINWDLYSKVSLDDKEITIYFKDTKFYVIYPHNSANIIVKDKISELVVEMEKMLDELNATYDKENLNDMLTGDKLEGFDFETIKESGTYVNNNDGTYTISFTKNSLQWEYDISSNYLISEVRCKAINFTSSLVLSYPKEVSITYPMGLDFLTVDIDEVKEVLEIDTFAEIIDKDLQQDKVE